MNSKQLSKGVRAAVSKFESSLKEGKTPARYRMAMKKIVCAHCGADQFLKGNISNLTGGIMASGRSSGLHSLVCVGCSRVELFAAEPTKDETEV